MKKFSLLKRASALGLAALHALAHAQSSYEFTALAPVLGSSTSSAWGINDQGWIVGDAFNPITLQRSGYLLSIAAVPEPDIAMLMLVGLAGLMAVRATGRAKG